MISILIPVNDYDIVALVHCMKTGIEKVQDYCEILIGDDGSSEDYREKYLSLVGEKVRVISSEKNVGRAAIRNKLISEARGDHLLIIDSDTMVRGTAESYLQKWLGFTGTARVICGGVLYHGNPPGDPDKILRWKYGKRKEQVDANARNKRPHGSFSTFNVMLEKSIFSKIRFYEELRQYGHEDTLFGYQLKKAGIDVLHIDNELIHEGLESNKEYLAKTKLSIENLSKLYDIVTDIKTFSETVSLLAQYRRLKFLRLTRIFAGLFIRYRDRMERQLDSANPSLHLFRFYKISMFSTYREIHGRRKGLIPFLKPPADL